MKKLLAFLLALVLILSLAACGGGGDDKTPSSDDKTPSSTQNDDTILSRDDGTSTEDDESDENEPEEETDPMTKVLNDVGLDLEAITPAEETFDDAFDEGEKKFTFYMEADTEKEAAAYINKIIEACKSVADDGKLYEANMGFYTGNRMELAAAEVSDTTFLYQFGYLKNGTAIAVTIGSVGAENAERADAVSYPAYEVTFGY